MFTIDNLTIDWVFLPITLAICLVILASPKLFDLLLRIKEVFVSSDTQKIYQIIVDPDKDLLQSIILLLIADVILLFTEYFVPQAELIKIIELPIGVSIILVISWLGYRLVERFFKIYVTQITQSGRKLNEDLIIVARWLTFLLFLFIVITIFSQTHAINIFGLVASVGIGGIAIAFAAQKTLEQLLGGVVIYLDRPFLVSDYIGLPDGTFGKVESVGLRSTKIRISGKGTLMVVPNNYLAGINIENFTGASKLISFIKMNFFEVLTEAKESFISELILHSSLTTEIDSRNLTINFQHIVNDQGDKITQAQIKYFIPLAGESSKEFRLQIINIVGENIRQKLLEHGINHEIVDRVLIDSQISI